MSSLISFDLSADSVDQVTWPPQRMSYSSDQNSWLPWPTVMNGRLKIEMLQFNYRSNSADQLTECSFCVKVDFSNETTAAFLRPFDVHVWWISSPPTLQFAEICCEFQRYPWPDCDFCSVKIGPRRWWLIKNCWSKLNRVWTLYCSNLHKNYSKQL